MRESSRSSAPQHAKPRTPGLQLDLQDRNTQKFTSSIVDCILARGVGYHTSDIHIEPTKHTLWIRFRIDEILGGCQREYGPVVLGARPIAGTLDHC
jgi:type II secretory ATPase GspE/PulE/Tfp pilus assembly ATPase PilB-like protein